jgi:putative membrane protein
LSGSSGRAESGPQSAAPLARRDEVEEVLAALRGYRMAGPNSLEIVSSRRIIRRILVGILPLTLILVAGIFFTPALLALPILIAALAVAIFERRFHRFGTAQGLLFVQAGLWRQRQWVVPLARIQSLKLSRGWIQRRLGLATLSVDTAGAPLLGGVQIEDIGEERARELADELARAFSA